MLLDRRALLKLGGFDEFFFFYLEDLELSLRLRAAGLRILCEPDAVIRHDRGDGTVGLSFRGHERYPWRRSYFSLRHRLRIILTYYRARTLLVLAPALLLYELASLVSTLRLGHGEAWSLAWASQFVHAREIRDRRRELARQRQRPDRELLRGGPLPLAPGFLRSREAVAAAGTLARALDLWWRLVRRWID
jgi:GT2 family glycosyltransferase